MTKPGPKTMKTFIDLLRGLLTSHRSIIKTLSSLVVINLIVAGLGFITRVAVANEIGIAQFGELAFAITIGTFGLLFVQFGIEKSLVRDLVHFPARFGELLKSSLVVRGILFAIFIALIVLSNTITEVPWANSSTILIVFASVISAFQLNGVYDAWKEMSRHAVYNMVQRLIYFTLVWAFIFIPNVQLSIWQIGIFMLVAAGIGLVIEYGWAWPRIRFVAIEGSWKATQFIFKANIGIWLAVLFGHTISHFSPIVLKVYSGNVDLGGYSAAWLYIQLAMLLQTQLGRIGTEATARHTQLKTEVLAQKRFFIKYVTLMAVIGLIIGAPAMLFPKLILSVFSNEYQSAADTLRILGLYPLFFGPYLAGLQYLISIRKQYTYLSITAILGVFSIIINLILVPQMQSQGAAIAVVTSQALAALIFIFVSWRRFARLGSVV